MEKVTLADMRIVELKQGIEVEVTKYRTESVRFGMKATIVPVEVERESNSSVWVNGRREAKQSDYQTYHDTWDQAHAYLIEHAEQQVRAAKMNLERAKCCLGNIKGMKKPS